MDIIRWRFPGFPRLFNLIYLLSFLLGTSYFTVHAQTQQRFEFEHGQMGTQFKLIFYATHQDSAERLSIKVFARLDSLNQKLSDYIPDSDLNQFCLQAGSKEWQSLDEDLWLVLQQAQRVFKTSNGAFDISVRPLSSLWRRAIRRQSFPIEEKLKIARKRVNGKWIKLRKKDHTGRLKKPGMLLDLGGIAKGYALDKMAEILSSNGVSSFLINGGGDLLLADPPPGKAGWVIETPGQKKQIVSNRGVASSGDLFQYLEDNNKRYSHIVNPRTGLGLTHQKLVTVYAPNGVLADAWASAFSILEGKELAKLQKQLQKKGIQVEFY